MSLGKIRTGLKYNCILRMFIRLWKIFLLFGYLKFYPADLAQRFSFISCVIRRGSLFQFFDFRVIWVSVNNVNIEDVSANNGNTLV